MLAWSTCTSSHDRFGRATFGAAFSGVAFAMSSSAVTGPASPAAPVAPVAPVAPAGAPAPVVVTPLAQSTATSAPYHSELPRVPENSRVLRRSRPQQAQQPAGPSYLEPTRASISAKRTKLGSSSTEDARRPLGENPNARAPHIGE